MEGKEDPESKPSETEAVTEDHEVSLSDAKTITNLVIVDESKTKTEIPTSNKKSSNKVLSWVDNHSGHHSKGVSSPHHHHHTDDETETENQLTAIQQSAGCYDFHQHKPPDETITVVHNFQRRMSRIPDEYFSEDSKLCEIKLKLTRRISAKILTEKLKKRVAGDKSIRNFRPGKCKYLDCLPIKWPKKISRNTLFHDYIFYGFAFALFISNGYLLSCFLHGYGYEYNLYAMGVLSSARANKPHSLITNTSLYNSSGILILLMLMSISSAIIGTKGYYTANRQYHYFYICLIGASIAVQCGIGVNVYIFKEHLCKQVKPFMDLKLIYLVQNYYTASQVIRIPTQYRNLSYSPKYNIKDQNDIPFRVRNYVDSSLMDVIQTYYFCCGYSSFNDYLNSSYRYPTTDPRHQDWKPKIPRTCCTPKWNRNVACSLQVPGKVKEWHDKLFHEGCSSKMDNVCKNVVYYLGKGMLLFSAIQCLFYLICLLCIAIQLRQIKRLERSSRFKVDPKIMERQLETRIPANPYDQAGRKQRKLDKYPNSTLLPKWYRDFLDSYRSHRGQYIYNRMHAAKYGMEPQPAVLTKDLNQQKLTLPLEKDSRGDRMPIATFTRPVFPKSFKEKYPEARNKAVLSHYDREINKWVTDVGLERKDKYSRDELAIVQYNESDWEEGAKRKLLIESDVLAKYHDLGRSESKPVEKKPKNDTKAPKNATVQFERKPGYPHGPSYMKSSWYSPKGKATPTQSKTDVENPETLRLSEMAKDPRSMFYKPDEDAIKRQKEYDIAWRFGKTESLQHIPEKKVQKIHRKFSVGTMKRNRFIEREMQYLSPTKINTQSSVDPIRVNYLEYKNPRPLKPPPLLQPPSEVSTVPASLSSSQQSLISQTKSVDTSTKSPVYYNYFGEELYKRPKKKKYDKDEPFVVNPKSKVPFDTTYYRQEKPTTSGLHRQVWEETETTHIGSVPEKTDRPKSYVNPRAKWEEKAKKFKW